MWVTAGVAAMLTAVFVIGSGTTAQEAAAQSIEDLKPRIEQLEPSAREPVDTPSNE